MTHDKTLLDRSDHIFGCVVGWNPRPSGLNFVDAIGAFFNIATRYASALDFTTLTPLSIP
jgi:hypothetical protein